MEETAYGNKVAPTPNSHNFIEPDKLSEVFDEYLKRNWAEELNLVKDVGTPE